MLPGPFGVRGDHTVCDGALVCVSVCVCVCCFED